MADIDVLGQDGELALGRGDGHAVLFDRRLHVNVE
jgi:hypothetical protein